MFVAWQAAGKRTVTRAESMGLGGLFLHAPAPPSVGSIVELIFDVTSGSVRARAVVRHSKPGKGMGVEFVHMRFEDRARLNQFLRQYQGQAEAVERTRESAAATPRHWFTPEGQHLDSGEIRGHHSLFTLLNGIYAARLTGKLQLVLGRAEKQLFFNSGQLIFATSNAIEDGLGEIMLRRSALTPAQFDNASERMRAGERFGAALVSLGVCDEKGLTTWVRQQVTQIAASIMDYCQGRYYFFSSFEQNLVPEIGIDAPLGRLLIEAVRRADDLPLDDLIHDRGLCVDHSLDPVLLFQAIELDENERRVLEVISHPLHVKDILEGAGITAPKAARSLYGLLVLGIVVAVSPDAVRSRPATAVPRPQPVAPPVEKPAEALAFEKEMRQVLELSEKSTYYQLLGVTPDSQPAQIKHNFYQLARKYHPDRHMGNSEWVGLLQELMGVLTNAYRTLCDEEKRSAYDTKIAQAGAFNLERGKTGSQETVEECLNRAMECLRANNYVGSIVWLRKCVDIAPDVAKHHAMLARSLGVVPAYRREAIEHFEKAIEFDAWNTSAYFQFGELYEEMQLPWRARPLYEKILEIDPEHKKARERLSHLQAKEGKKESDKDDKATPLISRLFSRKE